MPLEILPHLIFATLAVISLSCLSLKDRAAKPFLVIIFYWFLMLLLSNYSITGLYVPSPYSQYLLYVSFSLFAAGYFVSLSLFRAKGLYVRNRIEAFGFEERWLKLLVLIPSCFVFLMLFIALEYIISHGYTSFLIETRWNNGDVTFLFDFIPGFYFILSVIIKPLSLAMFFSFFSLSRQFKVFKHYLYLSIVLILIIAFVYSSRVEVIIVFIAFFFDYLLPNESKNDRLKKRFYFFISSLFFIGLLFFASYMRAGGQEGQLTVADLFLRYAVEYHLFGFTMFDIGINKIDNNPDHVYSVIASTVSIVFYPIEKFANLLGIEYVSPAMAARDEMLGQVLVGNKESNAFYTVFYLFYRDGGVLGLFLFSFIFGFSFKAYLNGINLTKHTLYSAKSMAVSIFLFYSCYVALLFPPQSQETYWFSFIYIYALFFILKPKS